MGLWANKAKTLDGYDMYIYFIKLADATASIFVYPKLENADVAEVAYAAF